MPAPASLGLVAGGDLYSVFGGGGITSPLTLTTTVDIPRSRAPHFTSLVILLRIAPAHFGTFPTDIAVDTITDDAPDPADGVAANTYTFLAPDGDGAYAYDFGRPTTECFADFDIQAFTGGYHGGTYVYAIACSPTRALPAGSTITIPFTPGSQPTTLMSATVLAFTDAGGPAVSLSARTINPADTQDGNSHNVPLGDHTLDELYHAESPTYMLIAHVFADDSAIDSSDSYAPGRTPQIGGSETITATGGAWTQVDAGGRPDTSAYGGLVYSVFTADASVVDLTEAMVQFTVSDGIGDDPDVPRVGADTGGPFTGVAIYQILFQQPSGNPAFNRVIPV